MKPDIKVKIENGSFKVLEIHGKPGDLLAKHKVNNDALLQVISGKVVYKEEDVSLELSSHDLHSIPAHQVHELAFEEISHLQLILAVDTKMKFMTSKE